METQQPVETQQTEVQIIKTSPNRIPILLEAFKENLAHARHVENERMTFVSIFLVSMGMLLEFSATSGLGRGQKLTLAALLLLLNLICTMLLIRWNSVYKGHTDIAKKMMAELDAELDEGAFDANRLYFSDNQAEVNRRRGKPKDHKGFYVKTATYFYLFNAITYAVIFVFMAGA